MINVKIKLLNTNVVLPKRAHACDAGIDVSIYHHISSDGQLEVYGTGIAVQPEQGFYFELVPRSSIIKTGYIFANSIGVIDENYIGEIKVPLLKIRQDAKIELPMRIGQLILRERIHCEFEVVQNLDETERGTAGFGSSGT